MIIQNEEFIPSLIEGSYKDPYRLLKNTRTGPFSAGNPAPEKT
jgi:hypothetical protein